MENPLDDLVAERTKSVEKIQKRIAWKKRARRIGVVLIVIGIVSIVLFNLDYTINVQYRYQKMVGGYVSNAYDAPTFNAMAAYLNRSVAGMHALGLTPDLYGRAFSWEQTPDYSMAYQYAYIQNLTDRAVFYYVKFTVANISVFSDVYNTAIVNLRTEFNANGPLDWVAWPAYLLKYAPLYYWSLLINGLLAILPVFGSVQVIYGFLDRAADQHDLDARKEDLRDAMGGRDYGLPPRPPFPR